MPLRNQQLGRRQTNRFSAVFSMATLIRYTLLVLMSLLAIIPFLWLLSTALKGQTENIFAYPPVFIPQHPTLNNFWMVFKQVPIMRYFANSITATSLTVLCNLTLSVLTAYPLAKMQFAGKNIFFLLTLSTMMIPFQTLMIPLYIVCLRLNLTDKSGLLQSWLGLALPFAFSGFGVFFIRQALLGIPRSLEESAVLDGCNSFQVLRFVMLPLIRPTLASLAVFAFMASWGEFLWPSLILSDPEKLTLPVGMVQLQSAFSADWKLIAAGTLLSILPVIVFFFTMQRYFVSGAMAGAVKE
jgi:putative chitobiose transport system permease protein